MKYHIYRHLEGSVLRKLPSGEYMRISCETCNREIRFEFDVSPRVDCSPCSDSHKTNTWSALFVVIVLFSILLGALLIVVIYYFTSQDGKDLFISFPAGIWVVISMVPLVAVGLLISIYYFVAENLYGNLIITRILNRGEKPHSKKK
jgi:magnesium-transporting ATPase (P-type)